MQASPSEADPTRTRRHLYGRRVGRGLTAYQTGLLERALPPLRLDVAQPAPQPLQSLFGGDIEDVWLEIGFGGGEHLAWQAEAHPRVGIIGCEPFVNGVAALLGRLDAAEIATVRIHDDDARFVLDWLPEASIGRVFVLFPDPWPKKRHRKRRLLSMEFLTRLAHVMRPGATLRFASDIADYRDMVAENVGRHAGFEPAPGLLAGRPEDWPATRYEAKALAAGRQCRFFIFRRSA